MSCHCNRRWVLVTEPAFSADSEAGIRKTSVRMSRGCNSPSRTGRPAYQNDAVSVWVMSRPPSQSSSRQSAMHERGIVTTDRRVLAEHEHATDDAVTHRQGHRQLRMVPDDRRHPAKAEVVVRTGGIAVIRLQKTDGVFREVVPPPRRRALMVEIVL